MAEYRVKATGKDGEFTEVVGYGFITNGSTVVMELTDEQVTGLREADGLEVTKVPERKAPAKGSGGEEEDNG